MAGRIEDVSDDVSERESANVSEHAGDRADATNDGGMASRRGWGACKLVLAVGPMLMALAALLASPPASGHDDPRMVPNRNDPIVRWYQPPGAPLVVDWDVETTPFEPAAVPSVFPAQAVPDESCWALHLETNEPLRVRVRAFQDGLVSAWSDYTVVPEPGLHAALAVGVPLLLIAARRRRRATPERKDPIDRREPRRGSPVEAR